MHWPGIGPPPRAFHLPSQVTLHLVRVHFQHIQLDAALVNDTLRLPDLEGSDLPAEGGGLHQGSLFQQGASPGVGIAGVSCLLYTSDAADE